MDYSYYSIYEVPLVTYGMIAITTGVLAFVSMSEDKSEESESGMGLGSFVSGSEDQPTQTGGKKRGTKQKHAKQYKKHTTKRHR